MLWELLGFPQHPTPIDILGLVSLVMLNASGIFQFLKNRQRESTEGVSTLYYVFLWLGSVGMAFYAWLTPNGFSTRVELSLGPLGPLFVLFQMWWYHPHRHVFHKYLMRNHHKEFMPQGEQEDVVTHTIHHRHD